MIIINKIVKSFSNKNNYKKKSGANKSFQIFSMSCGHRQHQSECNEIIYPKNSLLKYEPPRLIVHRDISNIDYKKLCRTTISSSFQSTPFYDTNLNLFDPYSDSCRPSDILDFLFPPIEFINKTNHKYVCKILRNFKQSKYYFKSRLYVYHVIQQQNMMFII